jgi:AraC family transcriptional regulator
MAGLVDELNAWLAQSGIQAKGPWMALYQAAEYRERDIPIELAVAVPDLPVGPALTGPTRVTRRTLPGVDEMACLMHSGPVSTLGQAYAELYAWMEANKRRAAGPARELYLRDVSDDGHATQVIEVQLPLEPAYSTIKDLANHQKEFVMEPKIIDLPAFNVAGLCYHGRNQNQEIAAMWGQFNQRAPELLPQTVPHTDAYGICLMTEGLPDGHFEYVAGLEVRDEAQVPEGMVLRKVPAHKYAVFAHRGAMDGLRETYAHIYQDWMPQSGLEIATPAMDMEVYTEEFKDFAPDSVFYIYVAVK